MTKQTVHEDWYQATVQLREFIYFAGIEKALEEMSELNRKTRYIRGDSEGLQSIADERRIIFDIPDIELRRNIIRLKRECYLLYGKTEELDLSDLQKRLVKEPKRIQRTALLQSLFSAAVGVFIGNHLWGTSGAIAGAAVTLLVGFEGILRADRASSESEEYIKEEIRVKRASIAEWGHPFYSENESVTGVPDKSAVGCMA